MEVHFLFFCANRTKELEKEGGFLYTIVKYKMKRGLCKW